MYIFWKLLNLIGIKKTPKTINDVFINPHKTKIANGDTSIKSTLAELQAEAKLTYETPKIFPIGFNANNDETPQFELNILRNDKGILEDYFFDLLLEKFAEKIRNDIIINTPDFTITPDFAYIDTKRNVYLIIEIDEPYTSNAVGDLIPIHYYGIDDKRNKNILNCGWSIIRFAEIQISNNPNECIQFVSDYVDTGNIEIYKSDLIKVWTYDESLAMISENYRDTYLPFGYQAKTKSNSNYSIRKFKVDLLTRETSKNGEKFIVLMIYIAKKASMNNGIMEFNHSGYCQCWIPEDIFWDNYSKTDVGKILFKQCSKEKHFMTPGFQMSFFAVGSTSGGYFNLYEKSSFIIEHPQPIIELAKKHGLSKTYLQIVQEYIETKKNEIHVKSK